MPTAIIAEDEPLLAAFLQKELSALWPELQIVHVAEDGIDAAQSIMRLAPDLAFLDIQMPGMSGLEVAQGIEGATRVVFVTAHDQYALQAFEQAALDYVLKPVGRERLARTLERLRAVCAPAVLPAPDASLSQALALLMAPPAKERLRYIRASQGELTSTVDDLTQGNAGLRQQIALRYLIDGIQVSPDEIVVTNGAIEALNVCLATVCSPGDAVVVESPCFYMCLQALERPGRTRSGDHQAPPQGVLGDDQFPEPARQHHE